jgi:hypothetical protein
VSTPTKHRWIIPAVVILLAILLIQLAFTAHRNSCTWDEQDHLYAGYMSWKHGDFGLNPEHPPLVKMVAAIPILNMDLKMPAQQDRFFKTEAFLNGKDFLFKNDANSMLFRARMAAAIFTLLLAIFVWACSSSTRRFSDTGPLSPPTPPCRASFSHRFMRSIDM